jgi:hypothetical protein
MLNFEIFVSASVITLAETPSYHRIAICIPLFQKYTHPKLQYFMSLSVNVPYRNFTWFIQDVHFAGLLDVQNILSADTGISRQTEGR